MSKKDPKIRGYKITHKNTKENRYVVLWDTEDELLKMRFDEELEINPDDYEWEELVSNYNPLFTAIWVLSVAYSDGVELDCLEFIKEHVLRPFLIEYFSEYDYGEIRCMIDDVRIFSNIGFKDGDTAWPIVTQEILKLWAEVESECNCEDYCWNLEDLGICDWR